MQNIKKIMHFILFFSLISFSKLNAQKNTFYFGLNKSYFSYYGNGDFKESIQYGNTYNIGFERKLTKKIYLSFQLNFTNFTNFDIDLKSKAEYDDYFKKIATSITNFNQFTELINTNKIPAFKQWDKVSNNNIFLHFLYKINSSNNFDIKTNVGLGLLYQQEKSYRINGYNTSSNPYQIILHENTYFNETNNAILKTCYNIGINFDYRIKNTYYVGLGINYLNTLNSIYNNNLTPDPTDIKLSPSNINLNFKIGYVF